MSATQSCSKDEASLPCVCVWIMSSVLCEVDTVVGALGGIRTGKGSVGTLTRKEERIAVTFTVTS